MLNPNQQKSTWHDQPLQNCPFKEKRTVADASGMTPSAKCEGPACELWLREEPRADSPGGCSLKLGGMRLIQLGFGATAERGAINTNLSQSIVSLQTSMTYLIKMIAKIGRDVTREERAEIEAAEKAAAETAAKAEAENGSPENA